MGPICLALDGISDADSDEADDVDDGAGAGLFCVDKAVSWFGSCSSSFFKSCRLIVMSYGGRKNNMKNSHIWVT